AASKVVKNASPSTVEMVGVKSGPAVSNAKRIARPDRTIAIDSDDLKQAEKLERQLDKPVQAQSDAKTDGQGKASLKIDSVPETLPLLSSQAVAEDELSQSDSKTPEPIASAAAASSPTSSPDSATPPASLSDLTIAAAIPVSNPAASPSIADAAPAPIL